MIKKHVKKVMVPKFIQIQSDDFIEEITYETEDGKIFPDKRYAEAHEQSLKISKVEKVDTNTLNLNFYEIGDFWYKAKDEEEAEFLRQYFNYPNCDVVGIDKIKPGEWFNFRYDDNGDYRSAVTIKTLTELKIDIKNLFEMLS